MAGDVCIQVFARAPVAGATKTRLIPLLGAEGAADLHRRLVLRTLATAIDAQVGPVQLWCTPSPDHEFFTYCAAQHAITLREQAVGHLGTRMDAALRAALTEFKYAIVVGCDCPALEIVDFEEAVRALRAGADAVVAPVEDGGYALLGLSRVDRSLFDDITWGSDQVMAMTRSRLQTLGWRWLELRTLWDIDRPEDVERMRREKLIDLPATQT